MDRIGRKYLLVGGLLLVGLLDLGSGITDAYPVFLLFRALTGVGWALFITTATTITIDTTAQHRGRSVGVLFLSEMGGTVVGATIGGWISVLIGLQVPFFLKAACAFVGGLICWGFFPSQDKGGQRNSRVALVEETQYWGEILWHYESILLLFTSFSLFAVQTGLMVSLYLVYLAEEGGLSPGVIGFLVSMGALANALPLYLGGTLSDTVGRRRVLIPGLLCYGLSLLIVPFAVDPIRLGLLSFALGMSAGVVSTLPTTMLGDCLPAELQSTGIGILRFYTDIGMIVGPLGLGALADWYTLHFPFYLAGGLLISVAGLHVFLSFPFRNSGGSPAS